MLSRSYRSLVWILCLVSLAGSGCSSSAAPMALKIAKYRKALLMHRGYRTRAVTAMEKQYDANHNGIIDPQEAMILRQRLMYEKNARDHRKMDLNGDGVVDVDEYELFRDENSNP